MGAATALLGFSDALSVGPTRLTAIPPYCFRAAAPGSYAPISLLRKSGTLGFNGAKLSDCPSFMKKLFRTAGAALEEVDFVGDAAVGVSSGGWYGMALGGPDELFHCASYSVPLRIAGITGFSFGPFPPWLRGVSFA